MARVESAGPFSAFEGIHRTLTILEGSGIDLDVKGHASVAVTTEPYSFPGDLPTSATLIDGPILDLNVMTRRGRYTHRVTPINLARSKDLVVMSPVALLYCHAGEVRVEEEFVDSVLVEQGNSLLIEGMPNGVSLTATKPARLFLIEIGPGA